MELTIEQTLQQGVTAHKAGKLQEAERLYRAILQSQPAHPDANHNLGLIAVSVNKTDAALPLFKTALEANPKIEQFWLSYIDALIKIGRIVDAQSVFDQARDKGANGEAFDQLEAWLLDKKINEAKPKEPSLGQLQPIIDLYTQGYFQSALSHNTELQERFPDSIILNNIAGSSHAGLKQFDAAIDNYKKALKINPDYADAYNNMGIALNGKGDSEAAIESYKKALKINPDHADAYNNMGSALRDKGDLEAAIDSCQEALKIKPDYAEAFNNMGIALKDNGDLIAAIDSYKKALKIKPDYSEVYNNMGIALQEKGDSQFAIGSYKQAIQTKPDYAEAYNNMGSALQKKGDLEEAIISYKQALKIKPDFAMAYHNLGTAQQGGGNIDAAAVAFRAAFNHDTAASLSLFYLHSTYYRDMRIDSESAIECLNEAVRISPTDGSINFFLGLLLDYKGHTQKAEGCFSLVHEGLSRSYAQLESWNWVKSFTSEYPLLFWQKEDGFDYAFDAAKINGLILEFGVAGGTSIRKLASKTDKVIHGFDSFQGLPESWSHLPEGAFSSNGSVPLAPGHVKFHVGLFDQTLPPFLIKHKDPIKFLNIDCDLYSSTKTVFDLVESRIVSGTVIFFDEYFGYEDWRNHEFKAFQEAVKRNGWRYDYLAINIYGQNAVVMIR